MYEAFYNFSVEPFRLTPNQEFCFSYPSFQRARTYLEYAVGRSEDFVMITGAPGTGKTTMINALLASLDNEKFIIARIESLHMEREDLLRLVALSLNADIAPGLDLTELVHQMKQFLVEQRKLGRKALLVIDEAQVLTSAALEELRLLQNMQEDGQVLLHVYLFGQEELVELINSPALAQLRERLAAVYQLDPLTAEQTEDYIKHRLITVGWKGDPAFHNGVFPLIYQLTQGIPRRVNLFCNRLLTLGFYNEQHELSVQDVRRSLDILRNERLIPIENGEELESSMRSVNGQQDEPRASGLKSSVASVLLMRGDSPADDMEASDRSTITLNSADTTRKKSLQSRKLWPMFILSALLVVSVLGLIFAFLLTFSDPLSTALLPSQGQQVHTQENPVGIDPDVKTVEASGTVPDTPNTTNDSSQKFTGQRTDIRTQDEGREPANSKHKRSEPKTISAGIEQKSANAEIDLRMQSPNPQESSTLAEPRQPEAAPPDQARANLIDPTLSPAQNKQRKKDASDSIVAGANAKQPNERSEMQPDAVQDTPESTQVPSTLFSELLKRVKKQRAELKITRPKGDNAFETYQLILAQDPANEVAKQGIIELAKYYLGRALFYQEEDNPQLSLSFIARGLKVMPGYPQLLKLRVEVQKSMDKPK